MSTVMPTTAPPIARTARSRTDSMSTATAKHVLRVIGWLALPVLLLLTGLIFGALPLAIQVDGALSRDDVLSAAAGSAVVVVALLALAWSTTRLGGPRLARWISEASAAGLTLLALRVADRAPGSLDHDDLDVLRSAVGSVMWMPWVWATVALAVVAVFRRRATAASR